MYQFESHISPVLAELRNDSNRFTHSKHAYQLLVDETRKIVKCNVVVMSQRDSKSF
jgi:hypothetical protein